MKKSINTFLKHTAKDFHNQSVNPPVVRASTIIFKSLQDIRKMQKKYKKDPQELPPRHVIKGWDLNIGGRAKSFVLEKSFPELLPKLNVIVSQRHNHNGLNEESIKYYENEYGSLTI